MDDAFAAVIRARDAAQGWAGLSLAERGKALRRLRQVMADGAGCLAGCVREEIGKPLQEAYGADILPTLDALQWVSKNTARVLKRRKISSKAWQDAMPLGVVGVIGTWNYPVFLDTAAIAWALSAGNAVVWKPSELAQKTAQQIHGMMMQAGLPVMLVLGDGAVGRELCHAGCDKIVFTGGVQTGRKILAELAQHGTPSVMELSGCDAMIICADADLETAAKSAVWGRVCNAGQSCVAPQRVFVEKTVYWQFLERCRQEIATLQFGRDYGEMRTAAVRERVRQLVCEAEEQGATVVVGGCPVGERGYAPTLLADCSPNSPVMTEDFFGAVLATSPVRDDAEAVARANDCRMGLGASVWTRDRRRGERIAAQLDAGIVSINDVLRDAADPALPFGGVKGSGWGKQRGAEGLEEFVVWKTVVMHPAGGTRRHLFPYRSQTIPILRGLIALRAAQGWGAKWRALRELGMAARNWNTPQANEDEPKQEGRGTQQ
jgi:acyl-CoA reductase-like NAD-dependent aldehyde dehydrogenase